MGSFLGEVVMAEMASEQESEESEIRSVDTRGIENKKKRKKKNHTSEASLATSEEETFLVGMVAFTRTDGMFKEPCEVGKFVERKIGEVRCIRLTRGGMVIIVCNVHPVLFPIIFTSVDF